ncbi:ComF family protein [Dysgonomonas alginatilytica]|uniref:ComF family protein n=1 Tax=Dysgonomonas alginatilytica TaxID=1605892 RepID=A0A2V3PLM3_9BACT|nr:phosphoribosyltransferase family protein [Dysgonomonas alginatilytica]PXV62812.1 ComF family protein [Dysgonomonas alginatilytica]
MVKTILNHFFELFFPRLCVCCGERLVNSEKFICLNCLYKLPKTNHLANPDNKLEVFFAGRFPFVRIASFAYFVKGGSIQKIIHEIKYKNNSRLAIYIGEICGKEIAKSNYFDDVDFIVPIPLHRNRLKSRGYNQAMMLANGISSKINIPVNAENLIRIIDNPSQTKNSRFERWKNTEGIFGIKDKNQFKDKHILLIDDVVTTGSTLEACAKLIVSCPEARISIFTVGFAV